MAQQHWLNDALDTVARNMQAAGRGPIGYRNDGRAIWPVFGASEPPAPAPPAPAPVPTPPEPGFPSGTPVTQMTTEQQAAYWKHYARQHEDRVKAFGDVTPEQLTELQAKAAKQDALELELGTTADKAAAKAAEEATSATRAQLQPQLIEARIDAAAARAGVTEADLAKALEFVDTAKFVKTDGTIDTDKVKAFVDTVKPATTTPVVPPRRGPLATPPTPAPGADTPKPGDGARAALARRGIKID